MLLREIPIVAEKLQQMQAAALPSGQGKALRLSIPAAGRTGRCKARIRKETIGNVIRIFSCFGKSTGQQGRFRSNAWPETTGRQLAAPQASGVIVVRACEDAKAACSKADYQDRYFAA
ncbi:MAG TPA: hypothetical protein PLF25_00740 [Accumulibacter sp.]|nr:hypothetical protein [Accumulibacter sp.]